MGKVACFYQYISDPIKWIPSSYKLVSPFYRNHSVSSGYNIDVRSAQPGRSSSDILTVVKLCVVSLPDCPKGKWSKQMAS